MEGLQPSQALCQKPCHEIPGIQNPRPSTPANPILLIHLDALFVPGRLQDSWKHVHGSRSPNCCPSGWRHRRAVKDSAFQIVI